MLLLGIFLIALIAFLSYSIGHDTGAKRGLLIGKDLEFVLFAKSMNKLKVQTKYADLIEDVKIQYNVELDNLKEELSSRER